MDYSKLVRDLYCQVSVTDIYVYTSIVCGVRIDHFNCAPGKMSRRSSRTIYVGNLPGDIRLREVEDLFYKVIILIIHCEHLR